MSALNETAAAGRDTVGGEDGARLHAASVSRIVTTPNNQLPIPKRADLGVGSWDLGVVVSFSRFLEIHLHPDVDEPRLHDR